MEAAGFESRQEELCSYSSSNDCDRGGSGTTGQEGRKQACMSMKDRGEAGAGSCGPEFL